MLLVISITLLYVHAWKDSYPQGLQNIGIQRIGRREYRRGGASWLTNVVAGGGGDEWRQVWVDE